MCCNICVGRRVLASYLLLSSASQMNCSRVGQQCLHIGLDMKSESRWHFFALMGTFKEVCFDTGSYSFTNNCSTAFLFESMNNTVGMCLEWHCIQFFSGKFILCFLWPKDSGSSVTSC